MIEVVRIAHPLREITLEYDRSKPELECEKELVGMLILKHDYWHDIQSEQGKLLYDIGEIENEVDVEAIRFNALEAAMLHKHQEIKIYTGDKKNEELVAEAREGFFELLGRMATEHNTFIAPLQKRSAALGKAFHELQKKFSGIDAIHGVDHDEYANKYLEVSNHAKTCSLDLVKYDDEQEALLGLGKKIWIGEKILKDYALKYQAYNKRIGATYALSEEIKAILTGFQDNEDILNCSISESYANGTGDITKKPFYIIPPGDPKIKAAKLMYGAGMGPQGIPQITFNTAVEDVRNLNVGGIVEQLAILQHFPALLERLVFTCSANIVREDDTILKIEELRGDPLAMEWYSKLRNLKCSLFFFESRDARAYIQIGDMKFDKSVVEAKGDGIRLSGDNLQEVCQRLYDACHYFMAFCHNTGFDPIPYIDSILAESGLPIPLEEVIADFKEDLANGIEIGSFVEPSAG